MRRILPLLLFTAIGLCCSPGPCAAAEAMWNSVGLRGGLSADDKDHNLREFEAFAAYQLPWELRAGSGWGIGTQLQATAGFLNSAGDYGFLASLGPALMLGKTGFPLEIDLGFSGGILTRDTFLDRDYNGYWQFISHGGLNYRFGETLGVGYRYQHMSNAGINGNSNPGVNMHLFVLYWYLDQ